LLNNHYGRAWELIDGEKPLESLAGELQEEFGERAPVHKTFAFYGELAEQNLIRFKGLDDEAHKTVAPKS